jgi:alkylhydroperoxidase family enzyme
MLRFHGLLPGKLREAAILMAGVEQQNVFEWQTHQKTARAAGLTEEEIFSIGTEGTLDAELTRVRDIVLATIQDRSVAQGRFDEFAELHGLAAAVELVTLAAFYRMMSGLGSAFESAMSGGEPPPWQSAE